MKAKYVHTNIVAKDWRALANFYINVFGCKPKPPERNLKGKWLDSATSLMNAHARGIHLYLPGYAANGPTLEIFQYSRAAKRKKKLINRPGFTHIAFSVKDVRQALQNVINHGGGKIGNVVRTNIRGAGKIEFVYACDPEGNIIELQRWE